MKRIALVLGLIAFSQPALAAKVTLDGHSTNLAACDKQVSYQMEVQGNSMQIAGNVLKEKLPINAAGTFDATVKSPSGNVIRFIGDINSRQMEVHNLSGLGCKWSGKF